MKVFEKYREFVNGNTVFIGHSMAPAFILSILEGLQLNEPVKASFFVAAWVGNLGLPEFDGINRTFMERDFDWEKIRRSCQSFRLYASDNDPYVPLPMGKELAEKLGAGAEIKVIKNAGHFNEKAGYLEFTTLLEDVLGVLQ